MSEELNPIVQLAKFVAVAAHDGQQYGDGVPYWHHLEETHDILVEFGVTDPEVLAAAWLHDVLEDCPLVTRGELLREGITPYTLAIVDALTEPKGNRAERHAATYPRIRRFADAVAVKVADRLASVRACLRTGDARGKMYAKEHNDFRRALLFDAPMIGNTSFMLWAHLGDAIRQISTQE